MNEHVVVEGNITTGVGVTSSIDFALTVATILESGQMAREIYLQIEYDPAPPFDCGIRKKAVRETVEKLRAQGLRRAKRLRRG